MTTQEKKEAVRQVIIRTIPNKPRECIDAYADEWGYIYRLADVLIAIVNKSKTIYIRSDGELYEPYKNNLTISPFIVRWDLSQDFDHQPDETIAFLWKLLV